MQDPFANHLEEIAVEPAQKITGSVEALYKAEGSNFITTPVDQLTLTFEGIPGDFHTGFTRKSGGREPWYQRGTEMRNERQVSILAPDELQIIARRLEIPELKPEWMGANMLLKGIPNLTRLPPRTVLFFQGGATIRIDGDNAPCRLTGSSVASQYDGREDIELEFPKQAKNLRGLVAWTEVPGVIKTGENFEARIPPQWIYTV